MSTSIDRLFKDKSMYPFTFNKEVSEVFDNMIKRSIPFYEEVNELIIQSISTLVDHKAMVIDLGCSTGYFLKKLSLKAKTKEYQLIGIDNSSFMLKKAKENTNHLRSKCKIDLIESDILKYPLPICDVVILNYALQFIKKNSRLALLKKIFKALKPSGFLIISEKISLANPELEFNHLEYKRKKGYSKLEISRKRDSLENVLVSATLKQNLTWLEKAGFKEIDVLFQWVNFSTLIAKKVKKAKKNLK